MLVDLMVDQMEVLWGAWKVAQRAVQSVAW